MKKHSKNKAAASLYVLLKIVELATAKERDAMKKHSKNKAVASLHLLLKIIELATALAALAATVISLLV